MRHAVYGRKLSRTKNERRRLFAGLVRDVLLHDRITTTVAKAKAVQPLLEKLISKAKEGSENSRRGVLAVITDKKVVNKLFDDAKTRFSNRSSGFTRIIKVGKRLGDATDTALLSFVDEITVVDQISPKKISAGKADETEKSIAKKPAEKKDVSKVAASAAKASKKPAKKAGK